MIGYNAGRAAIQATMETGFIRTTKVVFMRRTVSILDLYPLPRVEKNF
jgi:hypothetical protein